METERAVRVALVRLFAIRHDRAVPVEELAHETGLPTAEVDAALRSLEVQRAAVRTPQGWQPAALPLASRARESMAQFSWLH